MRTTIAVSELAEGIIGGQRLDAVTARDLLDLEVGSPQARDLMAGACRIRDHFLGRDVLCCSIINAKAGGCSENCRFCAQSRESTNEAYPHHPWAEDHEILAAAEDAGRNGAQALSLVAAWKGVSPGPLLDRVCASIRALADSGHVRCDVSLGLIREQVVADRIAAAGAKVYCHNLETARSFFPQTRSSHTFEERLETLRLVQNAGMRLCTGGILGLGESKDQRIEFFAQIRGLSPWMVPINFINPLPGTPLEGTPLVPTGEALVLLAVMRHYLPTSNLLLAGGKEVTFGDRLAETLDAGINAVMVGNYLTTLGTEPEFWRRETERRGLRMHQSNQ